MSTQQPPGLFDENPNLAPPPPPVEAAASSPGVGRVLMPNRRQLELRPCDLEALLPEGHRARLVWGWVMRADLSGMYALIRAVEGGSGRTPIAPELLFALWLYATLAGIGSARAVARLTQEHDAYRWLGGGVQVNYHTLADFRTAHGQARDGLLTDSVAALLAVGAVTLTRVAQDGIRIRASAGAASFRRGATRERCLEAARAQVEHLKRQSEDDPGAATRRQQAARERAARAREERIEQALKRLPQMAEIKAKQGKTAETARVSTTDAEATVMKMADGGYRPAYNGQFVSDTASPVMVGVEAATAGTDMAQLTPMIEQVMDRYGQHPAEWLVDGGYPAHEQLEAAAAATIVYAPVPKPKDADTDPHLAKAGDSDAVAAWRARMGTDEAKDIYKDRAATAECVNAQARERGLIRLRVRGTPKVRCVLLLQALAHNLMRTLALAPELLGYGKGASAQPVMAT
jgi:transposase